MTIEVQLTEHPIPERIPAAPVVPALAGPPFARGDSEPAKAGTMSGWPVGAWVEFRGIVRGEENGKVIAALEYEAYPEMAVREMRRLLTELSAIHPCLAAQVIHRVGLIPVGEAAIYVGIAARHRAEGFALLAAFMDRLKQDVPIWKRGSRSADLQPATNQKPAANPPSSKSSPHSLDDARALIESHCQPLPPVPVPLVEAAGRILRERISALEDWPAADKSTRDGYAILRDDASETFRIVDTLHAADWKPRQLQRGEAVRIATGASLPCDGLRVVMQEYVERADDRLRILRREDSLNIRQRGEEVKAGETLVEPGTRITTGLLALLATAGCAQPLVSPRLRVRHFTTGDEIVPPSQAPQPGQIRDSNSFLIRGLLEHWGCDVEHAHLPENFAEAKRKIADSPLAIAEADVLLISGGASVGEKDFTRPLLESLGFEIVVSQVNIRPGKPLLFGVAGGASVPASRPRIAFGLPGNPLSHFVCFQAFVTVALARLTGSAVPEFQQARLAVALNDAACPRETLWPARWECADGERTLHPLAWSSSGDVTCLAQTEALIRVPANCERLAAGALVEFLPANS